MRKKLATGYHWVSIVFLFFVSALIVGCQPAMTMVTGWSWDAKVTYKGGSPIGKTFTGENGKILGLLGPVNVSDKELAGYSFWLLTDFAEKEKLEDFYKDLAGKAHVEIRNAVADSEAHRTWKDVWTRYEVTKQSNGSWMIEVRGLCSITDPTDISTGPYPIRPYVLRLYTPDPKKSNASSRFTMEVRISKAQGVPQHKIEGTAVVPHGLIQYIGK